MLLSWSLVLYIIVCDLVTAHSGIGKGQEIGHEIVKKVIRQAGSISDENKDVEASSDENNDVEASSDENKDVEASSDENNDDDESNSPINGNYSNNDGSEMPESDENIPEDSDSQGSTEMVKPGKDLNKRSLRAGDTFTPQELLPVTIRLIRKVDNHGEGRGIVSSSKSPEDLADKIFGGYFLTMKRIVYLDEQDLPGLDAFQALALEGEDALNIRAAADSVTEAPMKIIDYGGQLIEVAKYPGRCHYKLMYKKVDTTSKSEVINDAKENRKSSLRNGKRILKLEKKLRPNRHLVVNYGRKSNNGTNVTVSYNGDKAIERGRNKKRLRHKTKKSPKKGNRKQKRTRKQRKKNSRVIRNKKSKKLKRVKKTKGHRRNRVIQNRKNNDAPSVLDQATTTVKPKCKWRYHCRTPGNLDSCRLHTSCIDETNPKAYLDNIFVDHREDEHDESVKQFRKMLGITIVDEDVEKIIEQHVLQVKPENMKGVDKIETLDEYFNNIIMAQNAQTTTPVPNPDSFASSFEKTGIILNSDSDAEASNKNSSSLEKQLKTSGEEQDETDDGAEELRASLKKEKKHTIGTSQPPDKKTSSLPSISKTKS